VSWATRAFFAVVLLLAGSLLAGSCATMSKDKTVCPEFRNLRCATEPDCTMDQARGCRVCRCSPAGDLSVPPPETTEPPR
jgi:hypothetical protein